MTDPNDLIDKVADTLKEPVRIDPELDRRVLASIETIPLPGRSTSVVGSLIEWVVRRRTIRVSPIGGFAVAATFVAIVLAGNAVMNRGVPVEPVRESAAAVPVVQFVLVARDAQSVTVVGDFNDWDVAATPLERDEAQGVWSVSIPLAPGRYRYSFLVDGATWLKDPRAAQTIDDEFGPPNSVITIGES